MSPYELVETTADIGIRVYAADLQSFFADAARGMYAVILDEVIEGWPASHEIELKGPDTEGLLVNWLSELLYLFDVKNFIFSEAEFSELTSKALRATVKGTYFSGTIAGTEIKAVTHHMLEISRTGTGYSATIIFDL